MNDEWRDNILSSQMSDHRRDLRLALLYKVDTGHVAVGPDQIGLVAVDNRTRANHQFKFRARGIFIWASQFICSLNSWWLEPAPCCCCWAGEPSCLQNSAWQASACCMSHAVMHHSSVRVIPRYLASVIHFNIFWILKYTMKTEITY